MRKGKVKDRGKEKKQQPQNSNRNAGRRKTGAASIKSVTQSREWSRGCTEPYVAAHDD